MTSEAKNPYIEGYSGEPTHTSLLAALKDAHYQANIIAVAYERVVDQARAITSEELINMAKSSDKSMNELSKIVNLAKEATADVGHLSRLRAYNRILGEIFVSSDKLDKHIMETAKRDTLLKAGLRP